MCLPHAAGVTKETVGRVSQVWQQTKVYSTVYSQAVTHPSTNTAQPCLTSVIRRELVHSR